MTRAKKRELQGKRQLQGKGQWQGKGQLQGQRQRQRADAEELLSSHADTQVLLPSPTSSQGGFLVRVSPHTGSLVISVKSYSEEAGQYRFTTLNIIKNYIKEELDMFHFLLENFHAHTCNQVPTLPGRTKHWGGGNLFLNSGWSFNWLPPKKLMYAKLRLGESTLTYIVQDTPNLAKINLVCT